MAKKIVPLDLRKLAATEPPKIDYVLPALPRGTVGLISGAGGAGKSMWALQASYQVAAGRYCDFGLGGPAAAPGEIGRVLYFNLEDPEIILHHRIHHIAGAYSQDEDRAAWVHDLADFIRIYPLAGQGATFIDANRLATGMASRLDDVIEAHAKGGDLRLIIVDTLRRAHDCNENDNGEMSVVLRYFEQLAKRWNVALLLLHHESKFGLADKDAGAQALRGASAIVDNARWVARIRTMSKKEGEEFGLDTEVEEHRFWLRMGLEKTNYGPPEEGAWLRRGPGGVLMAGDPAGAGNWQNANGKEDVRKDRGGRGYA